MGLRIQLKSDLERRFRETAMRRFGFGKGALSMAAEEAIEAWVSAAKGASRFEGDPVLAISGILAGLKVDSVELQHSVKSLWSAKAMHNVSR